MSRYYRNVNVVIKDRNSRGNGGGGGGGGGGNDASGCLSTIIVIAIIWALLKSCSG